MVFPAVRMEFIHSMCICCRHVILSTGFLWGMRLGVSWELCDARALKPRGVSTHQSSVMGFHGGV